MHVHGQTAQVTGTAKKLPFGFWLSAGAYALAFGSALGQCLWPLLDLQGLLGAIVGIFLSCADVSVSSGAFEHALGLPNMQGNFKKI